MDDVRALLKITSRQAKRVDVPLTYYEEESEHLGHLILDQDGTE